MRQRAIPSTPNASGGFTIVEVMVAMVILLVAVLSTLSLYESSLFSTQRTTAREQGTNLARDLIERSRQVTYANTKLGTAPGALRASLPSSDSVSALSSGSFYATRRGIKFAVNVFACSIDDPTDGINVDDDTYCAGPNPTTGAPAPPNTLAPAVNVLGVSVSLGSNAIQTVCNALGNVALLTRVQNTVSKVAPLSVCPSAGIGDVGSVNFDREPDDLHRVRVTVSWTARNRPETVAQTTLIPNPKP